MTREYSSGTNCLRHTHENIRQVRSVLCCMTAFLIMT